eukprot:2693787-Heterocapsa_arctica.AAC.1
MRVRSDPGMHSARATKVAAKGPRGPCWLRLLFTVGAAAGGGGGVALDSLHGGRLAPLCCVLGSS